MYCIYEDVDLEQIVTVEGNFNNPDDEADIDGDVGAAPVKKLYCAVAQTKLNGGIDNQTTAITIDAAVFRWTDIPVIKVDDELMYVTGGIDTPSVNLTVVRGWNNTTKAAHDDNAPVRLAYNGENVSVDCRDNEQVVTGDESSMVDYCLDDGGSPDGDYSAPLALGDIDYDETVVFHRRITVAAETEPQSKQDLIHDVDVTLVALDS